ncbi:hypothetical protein Plhal304r1_c040g0117821 [Plasmopara halstedii]
MINVELRADEIHTVDQKFRDDFQPRKDHVHELVMVPVRAVEDGTWMLMDLPPNLSVQEQQWLWIKRRRTRAHPLELWIDRGNEHGNLGTTP